MRLEWTTEEKVALALTDEATDAVTVVDKDHPLWGAACRGDLGAVHDYEPPPPPFVPLNEAITNAQELLAYRVSKRAVVLSAIDAIKLEEATRYTSSAKDADFPMLAACATAKQKLASVAADILAAAQKTKTRMITLEGARISALASISAAKTQQDIDAALADFDNATNP